MGNTKSAAVEANAANSARRRSRVSGELSTQPSKKLPHSARSSIASQGNKKPLLSATQRSIIKYCMDNAKDDIGERTLRRAMERKADFRCFIDNVSRTQRTEFSDALRDFLMKIAENLTDSDEIQRVSEEFGSSHVPFRSLGFKPDFFVCTAEAVTTECTFLDQATHTPTETAMSWSTLSGFVFSAVRDGYYAELRRQRRQSSSAFRQRTSIDVSSDGSSVGNRRSLSPAGEDGSQSSEPKETPNYLMPPQVY